MRVLQVIDSLHWGGVQELLVTLAIAAQNSEVSLSVASLHADEATPYRSRLERMGIPVEIFPARKLLEGKRVLALYRFMHHESFDFVHTHLTSSHIVGAFAARMAGIPAIATLHVLPDLDQNSLRRRLNRWMLGHLMHNLIAVGPSVAEAYSIKNKPIHVIPNAVLLPSPFPQEERLRIRTELTGGTDRPLIISTGRLDPRKGYQDLLNAVAILRNAHPSLCLLIVGGGKLQGTLEEQIQSKNLSRNVRLLGSRKDVPRLLAASDIYVSASHMEGMSIAILEAMAAGLPVVATCVGENSRFILPNTGIFVSTKDPPALAEAIARLIESPELRKSMGAEGRMLVSQHYNVETWFDQIRDVYKNELAGK